MQVIVKLKSVEKDLYKKQYPPKFLPFFSKKIHMTIKPLKTAAQIIIIDSQIKNTLQSLYNATRYNTVLVITRPGLVYQMVIFL